MGEVNYDLVNMLTSELSICRDELAAKKGKVPLDEERELRKRVGETIRQLNLTLNPKNKKSIFKTSLNRK